MNKLKPLSLIIICIFLINCTIQGLTNDYKKLSVEQKSLILPLKSFEDLENGKIYSLNSTQLKEELKKHPKSIVYVFTNGCVYSVFCK